MALAPIPAVPDAERRTRYVLTAASTASMQVGFAIWASGSDYANWVEVWQDGVKLATNQWSLSSPSGPLANLPRPITNAVVNPLLPVSGTIDIVGAERPRRPIQWTEGVGVPARDHNRAYADHTAIDREFWDTFRRTLRGAPGESINPIPPVAIRKTKALGFDTAGHPVVSDTSMADLDSLWDLIKYLEAVLAGAQKGNPNIVVLSSVDALRSLTIETVTATMATVQSHTFGTDKGGGMFRHDVDDTTSADDNGLIIVDGSARRWKRIVGTYANLDMFGSPTATADKEAGIAACFAQRIPMLITENGGGNLPLKLKIDPLVGTVNDREAWQKIHDALEWAARCSKKGKGDLEVHIFTANEGPIPVYGQYIHVHTNLGGNDIGTLSVSMPAPLLTKMDLADAGSVTFQARRSAVSQIYMHPSQTGKGYTVAPLVTIARDTAAGDTTGTGATATAFLDPRPGFEGKLGGIRIDNGGSLWTKPPIITLSTPAGGTPPEVEASPHVGTAADRAGINVNIQQATIFVLKLPENIQIGMPFGVHGYGGSQDCGAVNGCHVVKGFALNEPGDAWYDDSEDEDGNPTATNNVGGGRVWFDITAPRLCVGGSPRIEVSSEPIANICFPKTWLKSTGGWFGAGGGEGLFTGGGVGTVSLHYVAASWEPNGPGLDDGSETPEPSTTDQCFINTSRDGAVLYLEDRIVGAGFPGSGIRVARGACFVNRSYIGGGIKIGIESYLAAQVQNGGWMGLSHSAFGSSNGSVIAVQGGAVGYITHCTIGAGDEGVAIYGWADVQVSKISSCNTGLRILAGGKAYGIYKAPATYVPLPPGWVAGDPVPPGNAEWNESQVSTDVIECNMGLEIGGSGTMNSRIRFTRCDVDSRVPLNTNAYGGGYYETATVAPNQTVQVLQIRRQGGTGTAVGTAATLNQPAGAITTAALSTPAGGTHQLTVTNSYVNTTSMVRCAIGVGTNTGGIPVLGTVTATGTTFIVKIHNAGTTAFDGTLVVSFLIDDIIEPPT